MKNIKIILIYLIAILGISIKAFSKELPLISDIIIQNGNQFNKNHTFTNDGSLVFSLMNPNQDGTWSCSIKTDKNQYINVPSEVIDGKCVFNPLKVNYYIWTDNALRNFNSLNNRDEFILRVSFHTPNEIYDNIEVNLALLPSRPTIENLTFIYEFDWNRNCLTTNSNISFDVKSKDSNHFLVHYSDSYLFSDNDLHFYYSYEIPEIDKVHIDYTPDWGEYIIVSSHNDYGTLFTDTISVTSLIKDPKVLARIEELRQNASVEKVKSENCTSYTWDGKTLQFSTTISSISIYTLNGQLVSFLEYGQNIDLSSLNSGIYIAKYYNENIKKYITTKIYKK